MTEVVSFLVSNYVWILVIVIVTLLAIIGSYANKTNFGEGEKEEKKEIEESKDNNVGSVTLNEALGIKSDSKKSDESNNKNLNSTSTNDLNATTSNIDNSTNNSVQSNTTILTNSSDINKESKAQENKNENLFKSIEEKLSSLDTELNTMLPKKEIISDNMLEDIDDMSLNIDEKSSKKKFEDIKTSDIELPEIKSLKEKDEDIWNRKKQ